MPNHVHHFAINADDVERARAFYQVVMGWTFEPWGPPEFYQIKTGRTNTGLDDEAPAIEGALHKRRDIVAGRPIHGFECTLAVDDVDRVAEAVVENGGRVVMEKSVIAGVGELIFFEDTEKNIVGAMRYDTSVE